MTAQASASMRPSGVEANGRAEGGALDVGSTMAELVALANRIADLGRALPPRIGSLGDPDPRVDDEATAALEAAELLIRRRRKRDRLFGGDLFVDPIWNVLLDLYVADARGRPVSISSACIVAGVPATTAVRCCRMMEARQLMRRQPDPHDRRRIFLRLTEGCRAAMTAVLIETR